MSWTLWLDILLHDVKVALRTLRRSPGFSLVVILTVALGIGAGTSVFTVVDDVLLDPLPYPDSDDLVTVSTIWNDRPADARDSLAPPDVDDLKGASPSLASLVGYDQRSAVFTGGEYPDLVEVARVTEGLLSTFGLIPTLGRDIRASESGPDALRIAVISYGFWQDRFAQSNGVLGRTVELDGVLYEIVGVAPQFFTFPERCRVWLPYRLPPGNYNRRTHTWWTIGRLTPGATVASARAEAEAVASQLATAYPDSNAEKGFLVESLKDRIIGHARSRVWVFFGGALAVFLIACANVTNLLLARASRKAGEIVVRAALGAGRARSVMQLVIEGGVLATLGGAGGVVLALTGVEIVRRTSASILPRLDEIAVDGGSLLVTTGLIGVVTLFIAGGFHVYLSRLPLSFGLARAGRGEVQRGRRLRRALLLSEVALSVVLLSGTSLLLRTFAELSAVDPGFQTTDILRFTLVKRGEREEIRSFYRTLEERIAGLPGVESVGSIYGAPLGPGHTRATLQVPGRPEPDPGDETYAGLRAVSPRYLETMGIPLLRGRTLVPGDDTNSLPVAVVNQVFVRENFPGEDPIGKKVQVQISGSPLWTIVGVVGDIRSESLTEEPIAEIYVPHGQSPSGFMTVTVRSEHGARALLAEIRSVVNSLDPYQPLRYVETVADAVRREMVTTRFVMILGTFLAAIALILAAVGLHGALANLVSERTREIGVRVALGARQQQILGMVAAEALTVLGLGASAGFAVSLWSGALLESLLYGVAPRDPWTFGIVGTVLLFSALPAFLTPALRASRVDPMTALRME